MTYGFIKNINRTACGGTFKKREAVQKLIAEPYQPYQITVGETTVSDTGPVVIFKSLGLIFVA